MDNERAELLPRLQKAMLASSLAMGELFDDRVYRMLGDELSNDFIYFQNTERIDTAIEQIPNLTVAEMKQVLKDCDDWLDLVGGSRIEVSIKDPYEATQMQKIRNAVQRGEALIGKVGYGNDDEKKHIVVGQRYDQNEVVTRASKDMDCVGLVSYMFETPDRWTTFQYDKNPYFTKLYQTPVTWKTADFDLKTNQVFKEDTKRILQVGDLIVWDYWDNGHCGHVAVVLNLNPYTVIESAEYHNNGTGGVRRKNLEEYLSRYFLKYTTVYSMSYYRRNDKK